MAEALSEAAKSTGVKILWKTGGQFLIDISTDNVEVAKEVCKTAIRLSALYVGYQLFRPVIDAAVKKALGGERDDQEVKDIKPGSLHVVLHCFTDERFLVVLTDYLSGKMKERLKEEFLLIGIKVNGLKVEIQNMAEVNEIKEATYKRSHINRNLCEDVKNTAMDEAKSNIKKNVILKEEQGHQFGDSDSDSDERPCDDVKVNIAIVENAGSGGSCFVNAILGFKENDENAPKTCNGKEMSFYFHPASPNIIFSILPNIDQKTFPIFEEFIEHTNIENFDAFLIFTADMFDRRNLIFAKLVKSKNKPVFFVRTKLYDPKKGEEKCNEETLHHELRKSFAAKFKDFHLDETEIYIISTHHPVIWDFLKLTEAIEAALPSQKGCLSKIPVIQNLNALKTFHNYLEEENLRREDIPNYQEIKELFLHSGIAGVQRMMNKMLVQWKEVKIELAILGNSGAGKSSFVNAIRGVQDGLENSANTGITETTRVPTAFPHPANPNIRFWDLPGIGTPNYPDLETFCKLVRIEMYDTFLILSSTRFTENDKLLAAKVESMGKSFFFIRSKIDNDRRAERRKKGFNEKRMLRMIRDDCIKSIRKVMEVKEKNIFLISSFAPTKWDFDRLEKEILDQLPTKQQESFMLTLHTTSKDVLKEKIKHLKARLWMVSTSTVSKKFGFWPFSHFVHRDRLRKIIESYTLQMQFPNRDSHEFELLSEDLQKKVRKFNDEPYQDILQWLKSFDQDNKYDVKLNKKYIITKKPLVFINYVLNLCIDEMMEIGCAILDEAAREAWNNH